MALKTYLLDDDEIQLIYLSSIIEKNPAFPLIGKQQYAEKALTEVEALRPDIVFFDIELGTENGISLYKKLSYQPLLILCTSHLEFAVDAFELEAVDYLVKPVSPEKVLKALEKAEKIHAYRTKYIATDEIKYEQESLFVKDSGQYHKVPMQDILHIESMGNFAEFHIDGQSKKISLVSLKQLEAQLPATLFMRISRTQIINVGHIERVNSQEVVIRGVEMSIGKTYVDSVLPKILENQIVIKRKG